MQLRWPSIIFIIRNGGRTHAIAELLLHAIGYGVGKTVNEGEFPLEICCHDVLWRAVIDYDDRGYNCRWNPLGGIKIWAFFGTLTKLLLLPLLFSPLFLFWITSKAISEFLMRFFGNFFGNSFRNCFPFGNSCCMTRIATKNPPPILYKSFTENSSEKIQDFVWAFL